MTEPEDHRADRGHALASSTVVVAFVLFSQLVIVPLLDGRAPGTQAVPAIVVAVLVFGVTYVVSVSFAKRMRRRGRDQRVPGPPIRGRVTSRAPGRGGGRRR